MFRIGEFSQIARVSGRLLRYYDEIGLLRPQFIDPAMGYRSYSAQQLPGSIAFWCSNQLLRILLRMCATSVHFAIARGSETQRVFESMSQVAL